MKEHVCPWYLGYLLANPLRRLYQDPEKILGLYVKPGMKVLEVGPGMGFFTIPMARIAGDSGKIYSVDIQERMLRSLRGKVQRRGLENIIETRLCSEASLGIESLNGTIDFVLAFAVVHEIPGKERLMDQLCNVLKNGGLLLISEPKGHVKKEDFDELIVLAQNRGLKITDNPSIRGSYSAVFRKM